MYSIQVQFMVLKYFPSKLQKQCQKSADAECIGALLRATALNILFIHI